MPVLCIRRAKVSRWDFVAYVCFRPIFNPERLLHPLVTKSAGVCAAQSECDANRCVYRFPTLAWRDGQLRKKDAFRCESLPRNIGFCLRRKRTGESTGGGESTITRQGFVAGLKSLDRRAQA